MVTQSSKQSQNQITQKSQSVTFTIAVMYKKEKNLRIKKT